MDNPQNNTTYNKLLIDKIRSNKVSVGLLLFLLFILTFAVYQLYKLYKGDTVSLLGFNINAWQMATSDYAITFSRNGIEDTKERLSYGWSKTTVNQNTKDISPIPSDSSTKRPESLFSLKPFTLIPVEGPIIKPRYQEYYTLKVNDRGQAYATSTEKFIVYNHIPTKYFGKNSKISLYDVNSNKPSEYFKDSLNYPAPIFELTGDDLHSLELFNPGQKLLFFDRSEKPETQPTLKILVYDLYDKKVTDSMEFSGFGEKDGRYSINNKSDNNRFVVISYRESEDDLDSIYLFDQEKKTLTPLKGKINRYSDPRIEGNSLSYIVYKLDDPACSNIIDFYESKCSYEVVYDMVNKTVTKIGEDPILFQ